MKIGKAPVLLKKAVTMCKSKTSVLTSGIVLAFLRRKIAMVRSISHKIHTLMVATDWASARVESYHKPLMMRKTDRTPVHGGEIVDDLSHQFALFDQEENGDGGCPDWTLHPIFNDDDSCRCSEEYEENEEDDDEQLVIDVIRSYREVYGLEFNLHDDIDQAAEMFISRFREQMNKKN